MKLDYYDLISPAPFTIQGVGSIRPLTLREVSRLTGRIYSTYLALLNISPEKYCTEVNESLKPWYENLNEEQLSCLTMYDIAVSSAALQQSFSAIFDFFFTERVMYDRAKDAFLVFSPVKDEEGNDSIRVTGTIHKGNYLEVCDTILQFGHIDTKDTVDPARVKNKKGLARYQEMQKSKKKNRIRPKANADLELANIISAVCAMHSSINYTNVWDMTVYQLWDTFARLRNNEIYASGRTSVSVWGDKENKFDYNLWFKNITTTN